MGEELGWGKGGVRSREGSVPNVRKSSSMMIFSSYTLILEIFLNNVLQNLPPPQTWFWKYCSSDFLGRAVFFHDHLVNFYSNLLNIHGHKKQCHLGFDDHFKAAMGGWDFIATEMTRRLGRFLPFPSNSLVRASICQPSSPDDEEWSCFSSERFITPIP